MSGFVPIRSKMPTGCSNGNSHSPDAQPNWLRVDHKRLYDKPTKQVGNADIKMEPRGDDGRDTSMGLNVGMVQHWTE